MTTSEGPRPNHETPLLARVEQHIFETVSAVGLKHRLPFLNYALVVDKPTTQMFGAVVGVKYDDDQSTAHHAVCVQIHPLGHANVNVVADAILSTGDNSAFICEQDLYEQLKAGRGSVVWVEDGHYQLVGRPGGTLDVYTSYRTKPVSLPEDKLPPGTISTFGYEE